MTHALLPVSLEKNSWLSTTAGEIAIIMGKYWEKPYSLGHEEVEAIREFQEYLDLVEEGVQHTTTGLKHLSFDTKTLDSIDAKHYITVALIMEDKSQVKSFVDDLRDILNRVESTDHSIPEDDIWEWKKNMLELANLAAQEAFHPEASQVL